MPRDFFDPEPEEQNMVLIHASTLQKAQWMITGFKACCGTAEVPFDWFRQADRLRSGPFSTDAGCASRSPSARLYSIAASAQLHV